MLKEIEIQTKEITKRLKESSHRKKSYVDMNRSQREFSVG